MIAVQPQVQVVVSVINNKMKKAFTLIELLVVATIIGLLAAGAAVSYSQFSKQSRDARRKADLEQIRAALEMYKSTNNYYPVNLTTLTSGTVYIQSVPQDPMIGQTPSYTYQYQKLPSTCDNTVSNYCINYTLGAFLENSSTCASPPTTNCKGSSACNYCLGPYGQK